MTSKEFIDLAAWKVVRYAIEEGMRQYYDGSDSDHADEIAKLITEAYDEWREANAPDRCDECGQQLHERDGHLCSDGKYR